MHFYGVQVKAKHEDRLVRSARLIRVPD